MLIGVLQRSGEDGSEWQQDCLASLLKMLCHLGVNPQNELKSVRSDKIVIPNLNEVCYFNFDLLVLYYTSDLVTNLCPRLWCGIIKLIFTSCSVSYISLSVCVLSMYYLFYFQ